MKQIKILIPIAYFFPSQHGGPCNTVYFITQILKSDYDVWVYTTDYGVRKIETNKWLNKFGINVYYKAIKRFRDLYKIDPFKEIQFIKPDVIYLNSLFSPVSQYFAFAAMIKDIPIIWAPRGESDSEALKIKGLRKKLFLMFPIIRMNLKRARVSCYIFT